MASSLSVIPVLDKISSHTTNALVLFALVMSLICCTAKVNHTSAQEYWRVTRIVDGDTFYATEGELDVKFRLIGVDTPEYSYFGKPEEPYADAATEFLYELIADKDVILRQDVSPLDRYGRNLVYVYLADSTFVNAELMKHGWAVTMTIPPNVRHADLFYALQSEARAAKRGIWQD